MCLAHLLPSCIILPFKEGAPVAGFDPHPSLSPLQALRLMTTSRAAPPSASWRPLVAVPTSPAWARGPGPQSTWGWGMGGGTPEDILRLPSFLPFFFPLRACDSYCGAASSWGSLLGPALRPSPGVTDFAHPLPYTSANITPRLSTNPTRGTASNTQTCETATRPRVFSISNLCCTYHLPFCCGGR